MEDLFGAGNDPLVLWVAQFLLLGPIERAFTPAAKLDEMPVLVGPQGIGKSTLLRLILPQDEPAWFADGLNLSSDPKEKAEALQGRVIVEVSEMQGSTRADLEALKAFISRTDDGNVRLAYRRNPETLPRRCILVGTTNSSESLPNDPTGLRRFVPIALNQATEATERFLDPDKRKQLWAEGLHRYEKGARTSLPRKLMGRAAIAAEAHRGRDEILEDMIDEKIDTIQSATLGDVAKEIGMATAGAASLSRRDQLRLGAALRNRGFVKERREIDGQRVIVWVQE